MANIRYFSKENGPFDRFDEVVMITRNDNNSAIFRGRVDGKFTEKTCNYNELILIDQDKTDAQIKRLG
ncbi:MAG: hypothetical protein BAJALOKI3v1_50071 [Promethearchaeota archaeon]|nr:MAG: hypothetical protein BAJALOKI3v1_50071 [Candidatus Lokiarchaeota archaeon]